MSVAFPRRRFVSPRLNNLEQRLAPATFLVDVAGDGMDTMGNPVAGTLRWAISQGNDTATFGMGPHTINFNLPAAPQVITVTANLPTMNFPVTVNGRSQPGYAGVPIVEIQGNAALGSGLVATLGNSVFRGLIVNGFANAVGVQMNGANNVVEGCYIGTDRMAMSSVPNGWGIRIDAAENCTIGGTNSEDRNVISGSVVSGVLMGAAGLGGNKIIGNYIGTNVTGTAGLGNAQGLDLSGPGYTIGGTTADAANLISGNTARGISLVGGHGTTIQGNRIGTNLAGTAAIGNGVGILVDSSSSVTIGGTSAGARNLISGNTNNGLEIISSGPSNTVVAGNYIGTDLTGELDLGNGKIGVSINNTGKLLLGGTTAAAANVISGNGSHGIILDFVDAPAGMSVTIQGNFIGTDKDGQSNIGNDGEGILLQNVKNAAILNNVIADNDGNGIFMGFNFTFGRNTVQGNVIGSGPSNLGLAGNGKNGIQVFGSAINQIGGLTSGLENYISKNGAAGIHLMSGTFGNSVQSNTIASNLGNGILIDGGSKNNLIGGSTGFTLGGNFIQLNGASLGWKGHGIEVASGTGNAIRRNSFSGNAGRGIDLNNDSFDLNTPGGDNVGGVDDAKANKLQDYPVAIARSAGADGVATTMWRLDGQPFTEYYIEFFQNATIDPSGFGEGIYIGDTSFKTDKTGIATIDFFVPGFTLMSATATAVFTDPATMLIVGNTSEFSMVDIDCDGAADAWESKNMGIDVNEDGVIDLDLYAQGGRPDHRDIYVEVDAMTGLAPPAAIFDPMTTPANGGLIQSFAAAPAALIRNPDGADGVGLRVLVDESTLMDRAYPNTWTEFEVDKNGVMGGDHRDGHFGQAADRYIGGVMANGPNINWPHIRAARQLVYRYCIFARSFGGGGISGLTEGVPLTGAVDDLMVTIPPNFWGLNSPTAQDSAGTFMHELGHSLNLEHGGGDEEQYKPNYFSVMNYSWQIPNSLRRTVAAGMPDHSAAWKLDYSREKLNSLNELHLDESKGVTNGMGAHPLATVVYGLGETLLDKMGNVIGQLFHDVRAVAGGGGINWNRQNPAGEPDVEADINFDGFGGTLAGHNDWLNLQYYFRESKHAGDGSHGVGHQDPSSPPGNRLPTKVAGVIINDGAPQRSRIDSVTVNFDQYVDFTGPPEASFQLLRHGSLVPVDLTLTVGGTSTRTSVTLTFNGVGGQFGSLADGRYKLTVLAATIANNWGNLDGDGNGAGGDNFVLDSAAAPNPATNIFRLFGDADGNGSITATDFNAFRLVYGTAGPSFFDFDNDGQVTATDFNQFRLRYGSMVP